MKKSVLIGLLLAVLALGAIAIVGVSGDGGTKQAVRAPVICDSC
jgi:hypothetical protein